MTSRPHPELHTRPKVFLWLSHGLRVAAPVLERIVKNLLLYLRDGALRLAAWWQKQPWPMRLYSAGGLAMLGSFGLALIGITYRELPSILFVEGTLLLAAGILHELYKVLRWVVATVIGKVLTAGVAAMMGALTMGIASAIVNDTTGFPPADFPLTTTFLAPLTAGYIALLSIFAMFFVSIVVSVGLGMFFVCKALCAGGTQVEGATGQMFGRMTAAITLLVLTIHLWNEHHSSYESGLSATASWFAYNFEMYGKDSCSRGKHERVRQLVPGRALIGSERDGQRAFFVRQCSPSVFY